MYHSYNKTNEMH